VLFGRFVVGSGGGGDIVRVRVGGAVVVVSYCC
jgi:hypothetical protein